MERSNNQIEYLEELEREIEIYKIIARQNNELADLDEETLWLLEVTSNFLIDKALVIERYITKVLNGMLLDNSFLIDLGSRIKGEKRLKEKIYHKALKGDQSVYSVLDQIYDVLRYRVIIVDDYIRSVDDYLHYLEEHGMRVVQVKNRWGSASYNEISVKFETEDHFRFEIQFHTKESYLNGEIKTRSLYEITRRSVVPSEIREKAKFIEDYYRSRITIPEGALGYHFQSRLKVKEKKK